MFHYSLRSLRTTRNRGLRPRFRVAWNIIFLQGAFDYCQGLGGILPSFDFFDYYNQFGEAPRTSNSTTDKNPTTTEEEKTDAGSNRPSVNNPELDLDTSDFEVCEKTIPAILPIDASVKVQKILLMKNTNKYFMNNNRLTRVLIL